MDKPRRDEQGLGEPRLSVRSHLGEPDRALLHTRRLAESHPSFIDATCSNPTRVAGLPHPSLQLGQYSGRWLQYGADARGARALRERISRDYSCRADVATDQVLLTASTSEAYALLFQVLCDPGDAILVPQPSYPLLEHLAALAGVRVIHHRLAYDGSWHLDASSLPSPHELSRQRVRAVLSVSPNNPTGSCYSANDWNLLGQLELPVIVDEVFRPYRFGPMNDEGDVFACLPRSLVCVLDGVSKRCLAPGHKLGWLVAHGPGAESLLARAEMVNDAYLSVSAWSQLTAPALLDQQPSLHAEMNRLLEQRWSLLRKRFEGSGVDAICGGAGWNAILRLPALRSEDEYSLDLAHSGIWLQPGRAFPLPFEVGFVVSLLTPAVQLAQVADRVLRSVSAS